MNQNTGYFLIAFFSALLISSIVKAVPSDIDTIRNRIIVEIMSPGVNDQQIEILINRLGEDGSWPEINYEDVSRTAFENRVHVQNLREMSVAFRKPGSIYQQDESLEKAISSAIDFWLANDFIADNWHTNEIANPSDWVAVLYLMDGNLTQKQLSKISELAGRANLQAWGARPGGDLIKIAGLMAELAVFHRDETLLKKAVDAMVAEVNVSSGLGIKPDLGFHHRADRVTSILAYGIGYAATFANWTQRLSGTEFQLPESGLHLLVDYYLDGICQSMVHAWYKDPGAMNRGISRDGALQPISPEIPEKLLLISDYRKDDLEKVVSIRKGLQAPNLKSNRFFWHSEYASHQRPEYFASVRMFSDRNHNMESPHNQESLKMHHFADGSNFVSRTGKEFYDIFPVWDWQKIPGTTVVQKPELPPWNQIVKKGRTEYVGAVSDGIYGAAVFDFQSPHDPLSAHKAWFFFDEAYVCLGAGIVSSSDFPVSTTINQTLLQTDVQIKAQNKKAVLSKGEHQLSDVLWVLQDSIGYFFPTPVQMSLHNQSYTGKWQSIVNTQRVQNKPPVEKELFRLWLDHGVQPKNDTYEYMVIPSIGVADMEDFSTSPTINTLSNTPEIQAVHHEGLKLTQIAFFQPGSLTLPNEMTVTAHSPGLMMIQSGKQEVEKITVADPSRKLQHFVFEISGEFKGHGPHWEANWNPNDRQSKVIAAMPSGNNAGKSLILQANSFEGEKPGIAIKSFSSQHAVPNSSEKGKHYIGQKIGGGTVVWVDESGSHGIVAATQDQAGRLRWKNGKAHPPQLYGDHGDRLVNAVGEGLFAGELNTMLIVSQLTADDITGDFAAKACMECNEGGYGDWYLPSKDELGILFQNKDMIGGFRDEMYGSSTEYNIGFVWGQIFNVYGGKFTNNKGSGMAVRCVRRF